MSGKRLAGVWLSAAALAACGQAFSTATGADGGAADAVADPPTIEGGGQPDAGSGDARADAPADAVHADSTGVPDAPALPDGTTDGATAHDAFASDAIVSDAVSIDGSGKDAIVAPPKRVFVTSDAYSGNLGGLAGADAICQDLATGASLDGVYKAWLSSTTTSAASRLTHVFVPYVLVNGVVVADGWDGLTSGTLLVPINVNEKGGPPPILASPCGGTSESVVWTSTATSGALGTTQGATCDDWASSGPTSGAILGYADRTDSAWTDGCALQGEDSTICSSNAALYCIEQ